VKLEKAPPIAMNFEQEENNFEKDNRQTDKYALTLSRHKLGERVFNDNSVMKRLFLNQCSLHKISIAQDLQVFECEVTTF